MARAIVIFSKYVVFPGVVALALMELTKPSSAEIDKIKAYSGQNNEFTAVLQAAANPNSRPMYSQKPGEQHPVPELAKQVDNKR